MILNVNPTPKITITKPNKIAGKFKIVEFSFTRPDLRTQVPTQNCCRNNGLHELLKAHLNPVGHG